MAALTADKGTPRPLWHAPLFLVGLAVFCSAWMCRPLWPDSLLRRITRDLANARAALAKPDGDAEFALKLATRALENGNKMPEFIPDAAFLAGSAALRVAEKAGPRSEMWAKAREWLEQASELGLQGDEDQHRLAYRLAKAGSRTGMEPRRLADQLELAAPHADNRPEAFGLLAGAYLAQTPPDLERALKANHRLRELQEVSDTELTAAKIQGGEILLLMGKPAEARKSLEKIDDRAGGETGQRARLLRARAYEDEKEWEKAALEYQAALIDGRQVSDPAQVRYHLGLCYRGLDRRPEAVREWRQCVESAKGPEGLAAAVAMAELHLLEPALEPALEAIELAAVRHRPRAKWDNPLLEPARLTELHAKARAAFAQADRPDLAYRLTALQARTLDPARALVMKADAASGWGRQILARAPAETPRAKELLAEAGAAYKEAAGLPGLKPDEQAEYLFQAARCYFAADDRTEGATTLYRMTALEGKPERMGEACYLLAEHYREEADRTKDPLTRKKAAEKYHDCMKYSTRFEYLARFRLAMADLEAGDLDNAQAGLAFNLKMLRWDEEPDAMAESLFAISNLLYQKRDFNRVMRYLEDLLARAKDSPKYKDSPELTRARYQLADAYQQIAAREMMALLVDKTSSKEAGEHYEQQQKLYLKRSADEFLLLDAFLQTPAGATHLTKEQRTSVPFKAAKCLYNQGRYKEALEVYDRLAQKHQNAVEGLDALGGAVQCHAAMRQEDEIRQRLLQIERTIEVVEKTDPKVGEAWKDWARRAREPLKPIQ